MTNQISELIMALRNMDQPDMTYGYNGAYKWCSERIGRDAADLIESLLIEPTPPCKIGDTVYYFFENHGKSKVVKATVCGYGWLEPHGFSFYIAWDDPETETADSYKKAIPFSEIGHTVFLHI